MTIGEQLISNFPTTVKKDDIVFISLVANTKKTGVLESVLNDADSFSKEYSGNTDVYDQEDALLEQTIKFFSYIEKNSSESDDSIKNRISAIFKRNGDTVWGTPIDVINVFRQYFPSASVYLCENSFPFNESILEDGDFQNEEIGWNVSDSSIRQRAARFVNSYGIKLDSSSDYVDQDVELNTEADNYTVQENDTYSSLAKLKYGNVTLGDYIKNYDENPETITAGDNIQIPVRNVLFLHFFSKNKINVIIKDLSNSKYWNNSTKTWESTEVKNQFISSDWANNNLWFIADNTVENINVKFEGVEDGYVDYVRLFYKKQYSTFCVLVYFATAATEDALSLATGTVDEGPIENIGDGKTIPAKYGNFGYFDGIYITGANNSFAQELYEDLLDYIHTSGVKPYLELISKDE